MHELYNDKTESRNDNSNEDYDCPTNSRDTSRNSKTKEEDEVHTNCMSDKRNREAITV